jgi:tetraacyldisaccharide 4'-kinase
VAEAGDEPALLARAAPGVAVVVGADRYASGRLAEQTLGCTIHVLDDGFQHMQVARDVDLLVTSPGEIERGRVLPFGRLREGAEAAAAAHGIVVVGAMAADAAAEAARLGVAESCGARRVLDAPALVAPVPAGTPDPHEALSEHMPVVAAAGIAYPERFFDGLREQGWALAGTLAFPDHHWYTTGDVTRLFELADAHGVRLVLVTGKDAVKLEALGPLPVGVASVPMHLEVDPGSAIDRWIDRALLPPPGRPGAPR